MTAAFLVQDWHPVLAQDRGRARAQPGLRRGRAWDRATTEHGSSWRQQDVTMAAASLGPWRPKKKLPCVFELRFEIWRHPDTTWAQPGLGSGRPRHEHTIAAQQPAAARGHHGGCIAGSWLPKQSNKLPCVFELRFEIRRHPDTTWLFPHVFSARLAPCAGPGPRQSQGSAR
eukprot:gene6714-biopygen17940